MNHKQPIAKTIITLGHVTGARALRLLVDQFGIDQVVAEVERIRPLVVQPPKPQTTVICQICDDRHVVPCPECVNQDHTSYLCRCGGRRQLACSKCNAGD